MSLDKHIKTEHCGAKNGGGYWGTREEAKAISKKVRRIRGKRQIANELAWFGSGDKAISYLAAKRA